MSAYWIVRRLVGVATVVAILYGVFLLASYVAEDGDRTGRTLPEAARLAAVLTACTAAGVVVLAIVIALLLWGFAPTADRNDFRDHDR